MDKKRSNFCFKQSQELEDKIQDFLTDKKLSQKRH